MRPVSRHRPHARHVEPAWPGYQMRPTTNNQNTARPRLSFINPHPTPQGTLAGGYSRIVSGCRAVRSLGDIGPPLEVLCDVLILPTHPPACVVLVEFVRRLRRARNFPLVLYFCVIHSPLLARQQTAPMVALHLYLFFQVLPLLARGADGPWGRLEREQALRRRQSDVPDIDSFRLRGHHSGNTQEEA